MNEIKINSDKWKVIFDHKEPHTLNFPEPFDKVQGIGKLVLLRCIRYDKIIPAIQDFIERN